MKNHLKKLFFVPLWVLVTSPVLAQDQSQTPPPPPPPYCENNPGFSDFDFWVGEWNVYSTDGKHEFQGTNSVTKHYNNCLVLEHWEGAQGGAGMSINYFNPVSGEWRQVWVANGYSIDYTGGLDDQGRMVLEGELYGYRKGATIPFRGIWTPEANGDVLQHFDIYDPDKKTWNLWFEGLYVKKDKDAGSSGDDNMD